MEQSFEWHANLSPSPSTPRSALLTTPRIDGVKRRVRGGSGHQVHGVYPGVSGMKSANAARERGRQAHKLERQRGRNNKQTVDPLATRPQLEHDSEPEPMSESQLRERRLLATTPLRVAAPSWTPPRTQSASWSEPLISPWGRNDLEHVF